MPHNFIQGINWASDPTGETRLTTARFIAVTGNDANDGTNPNSPKRTLSAAQQANIMTSSAYCVVGPGIYEEVGGASSANPILFRADNLKEVIIKSNGVDNHNIFLGAVLYSGFFNTVFLDLPRINSSVGARYYGLNNCLVENCPNISLALNEDSYSFVNSIFINCTTGVGRTLQHSSIDGTIRVGMEGCIWINSIVKHRRIRNTYFHTDCILQIDSTSLGSALVENCNIRCPVSYQGNSYADLAEAQTAHPTVFVDCINVDPQFISIANRNFNVLPTSPHLGTGYNRTNIANSLVGINVNTETSFFQNATFDNVEINLNNELVLINPVNIGTVTTTPIDLGSRRTLGRLELLGTIPFSADTPDFDNKLINNRSPNIYDYELRWANSLTELYTMSYKVMRWNMKPSLDGAGKSTGEAGVNYGALLSIIARYIQVRITLRQDFVA